MSTQLQILINTLAAIEPGTYTDQLERDLVWVLRDFENRLVALERENAALRAAAALALSNLRRLRDTKGDTWDRMIDTELVSLWDELKRLTETEAGGPVGAGE